MTDARLNKYREQLRDLSSDVRENVDAIEEQVRQPTGGQADGGLSNAPMHLGDLGTDTYLQELNSTLAESEQDLSQEISAARHRIEDGTFGICEECGEAIPEARLEVLPYTRYCVACAETADSTPRPNLNSGRPQKPSDTLANRVPQGPKLKRDEKIVDQFSTPDAAIGTAGGGTAVGGLAGTNRDEGDPADVDLDGATASGRFAPEAEETNSGYAGRSGGAIDGTPANQRGTPRNRQSK